MMELVDLDVVYNELKIDENGIITGKCLLYYVNDPPEFWGRVDSDDCDDYDEFEFLFVPVDGSIHKDLIINITEPVKPFTDLNKCLHLLHHFFTTEHTLENIGYEFGNNICNKLDKDFESVIDYINSCNYPNATLNFVSDVYNYDVKLKSNKDIKFNAIIHDRFTGEDITNIYSFSRKVLINQLGRSKLKKKLVNLLHVN